MRLFTEVNTAAAAAAVESISASSYAAAYNRVRFQSSRAQVQEHC